MVITPEELEKLRQMQNDVAHAITQISYTEEEEKELRGISDRIWGIETSKDKTGGDITEEDVAILNAYYVRLCL